MSIRVTFLLFLMLLFAVAAHSQVQLNWVCTLELPQEKVLPYETLGIVVTLTNHGENTAGAVNEWQLPISIGEKNDKGEIVWRPYTRLGYKAPERPNRYPVQLKPGEAQTWTREVDFDEGGQHVFAKPGAYYLKVTAGLFESAPYPVTISTPEGDDAAAYQALTQTDLARFFNGTIIGSTPERKGAGPRLAQFIADHPKSRYAQWAQMGRALLTLYGGLFYNAAPAQKLLLELAAQATPPVKAQAYIHLAEIAQTQRKTAEIIDASRQILASTPTPAQQLRATNWLKMYAPAAP